jgi:SpoVK/Ycf46/Vps4 family AAA+-type ATPase
MKTRELVEKSNKMYYLELITLSDSKFANDANLNLTDKSIEMFFQEDAELFLSKKKQKNIILNKDIVAKELFYDGQLAEEVGFLTESLQNEHFKRLQTRMSEMSLNKGVACIFYGSPGTGKTESAFQIAKSTGRDIMSVDISQTKSMWFGESEKRIKDIFDSYRKIAKTVDKLPILLFNEADAVLNQRHNNSNSNVGQTENAIQNILLEELEKFEGIMIATTNLQGNLDAAYERRFLFKIKFETPTVEVKSKIWQNKLTWIEGEFAQKLSNEFSFSGGEIDNIVRKVTMKEVLSGKRPDSNEIYSYCLSEKVLSNKKGKIRVGFE